MGSSPGIHGAGAALLARKKFGAEIGVAQGFTGQCYAVPTKDENIKTLPLGTIAWNVYVLRASVVDHPQYHFLITKIGCGLAGYRVEEIAPLFKNFLTLDNVSLPKEFVELNTEQNADIQI